MGHYGHVQHGTAPGGTVFITLEGSTTLEKGDPQVF